MKQFPTKAGLWNTEVLSCVSDTMIDTSGLGEWFFVESRASEGLLFLKFYHDDPVFARQFLDELVDCWLMRSLEQKVAKFSSQIEALDHRLDSTVWRLDEASNKVQLMRDQGVGLSAEGTAEYRRAKEILAVLFELEKDLILSPRLVGRFTFDEADLLNAILEDYQSSMEKSDGKDPDGKLRKPVDDEIARLRRHFEKIVERGTPVVSDELTPYVIATKRLDSLTAEYQLGIEQKTELQIQMAGLVNPWMILVKARPITK